MPDLTSQLYRMKIGTVTAAVIAADAGALVRNWTTTLTTVGWLIASRDLVFPYVQREQSLAGTFGTFGAPNTEWRIARMNDAMYTTLLAVLTGESTAVTIYTKNRFKSGGAAWQTFNCLAHRPDLFSLPTKDGMWYINAPISFTDLVVAAAS